MTEHLMDPLRDEHRDLLPHIQQLRTVADAVGEIRPLALTTLVDETLLFLQHHLLPHARAEEVVLYPAVGVAMGAAAATRTMSRDHVEVERLIDELASLRGKLDDDAGDDDLDRDLRRVLYGLYAVVRLHFAKEEEVYVPLLEEALDEPRAAALFSAMHTAAHEPAA
jgi:iron-sulfur cluster repair protein YtfE (RIC family)